MINRYFQPDIFTRIQDDFYFLPKIIDSMSGEVEFYIRENYFNLYSRGNSLARVEPIGNNSYSIAINSKFVSKDLMKIYPPIDLSQKIIKWKIDRNDLHSFFQVKHLSSICRLIKEVNYNEELNFEQAVISENYCNSKYVFIDRQISDHTRNWSKRIDLLCLRRENDGQYGFVVVEVKLGNNVELKDTVLSQIKECIVHIKAHLADYQNCYAQTFKQMFDLGFINKSLHDRKEISFNSRVGGKIIVVGYPKCAKKYLEQLNKTTDGAIDVQRIDFSIQ
jgi:hypothetical protein